jgi:hypothetical protein
MHSIFTGTPLFLQDVTTGLLFGLFEAASPAQVKLYSANDVTFVC